MKLVILGDTHFGSGYSLGKTDIRTHLNTRLLDFSNTFDFVVDYMVANHVKHFVITGDIFEHRRPQASELSLFSKKMRRLTELGIHTHVVVGNHDIIREQKTTTIDVLRSLKLPMVHIYPDIESTACSDDSGIKINLIFFPFRTRQMLDCSSNDEAVGRLNDRLQYEIRGVSNKWPTILVGHMMFQETRLGSTVLEGEIGEVVLPLDMFKDLDATIMGHIHPHQIINKKPLICYVGQMDARDFGEGKYDKYLLAVEYKDENLVFSFEKLPVRLIYDIIIDQTSAEDGKEATESTKKYLKDFSEDNNMIGSIVRITIVINEKSIFNFNKESVRYYLRKKLLINHCVGIYPQVISKRQLRKSSITESLDLEAAFDEFLELEDDLTIRERMREIGTRIIKDRRGR